MTGVPQFVDISSYNGTIDFPAYCAWAKQFDGISRIAIKATEGIGFTDPQFAANRARALNAGIDQIFYYHFSRPDLGNSAQAEADYMCSVVGAIRSQDIIILDYEVEAPQATSDWALAWLLRQQSSYGKAPGIYASSSYVVAKLQNPALEAFPLWLANWTFDPNARPASPSPWTGYSMLQYTDRATNIPGIAGTVDADIFLGGGATPVQQYGPNSADFNAYFAVDANGNWVCKQTSAVIIGGNLALYQTLSMDGNTLPVIGLPLQNEQYAGDKSTQEFERATIVYNPNDPNDRQPGIPGISHLAIVNPPQTVTVTAIPQPLVDAITTVENDMTTLQKDIAAMQQIEAQFGK